MNIKTTDQERWELYGILDLREKLSCGEAYLRPGKMASGPPTYSGKKGTLPTEAGSQMVDIHLTINDWFICRAHRYVMPDESELTGPDPKLIRMDDLVLQQ